MAAAAWAVPAAASVLGGVMGANATRDAARSQRDAARESNDLQWRMFQQQQDNQRPWQQTGASSLGMLGNLFGINSGMNFDEAKYLSENPDARSRMYNTGVSAYDDYLNRFGRDNPNASQYFRQGEGFGSFNRDFSMADFQADPGFQFRLDQGMRALERSGAARGASLSGAQMKGIQDYGQGAASQEYGNAYGRFMNNRSTRFGQLSSLAGLGQAANAQAGNMAMQTGQSMGQNLLGAGNAAAAGAIGQANVWTNTLNNLGNQWQTYQAMNNQTPGYGWTGTNLAGTQTGNFGTNGAWASLAR